MSIIAKEFAKHKRHFILQPLIAAAFIVLMLTFLGGFDHVDLLGFIGTSTLGSSAFLVFSAPNSATASIKRMWGGYAISVAIAVIFSSGMYLLTYNHVKIAEYYIPEIAAVLTMMLSMFCSALFRLEHPPAVGLALGLVVEPWTPFTLTVILVTIILMSLVKYILRNWLIDLVKS